MVNSSPNSVAFYYKYKGLIVDKAKPKLNVIRKDLETCHIRLDIEVTSEDVKRNLNEMVNTFRKSARVPGFRTGKAPRNLLLRRFKKDIFDETKRKLIQESMREACDQEGLVPETSPRVENEDAVTLVEDAAFAYAVTFDVAPSFELPEYKGVKLSRKSTDVDDQSVQEVIDSWLQQRASYEKVDRPAVAGDLLKLTYHGRLLDAGADLPESAKFILDAEETWLGLREPEIIPGAIKALIGVEAGDEKQLNVEFPEDFLEHSLIGRKAEYSFSIIEVHVAQVPQLDDELARQIGAENADQVRNQVKENLEADKTRELDKSMREQAVNALMEKVECDLPPTILSAEAYQIFVQMFQEAMRNGQPQEDMKARQKELLEEARKIAHLKIKRQYIFGKIAEKENIGVTKEETNAMVDAASKHNKISPKVMLKRLQESGRINDFVMGIREAKAIDRVIELAEIDEATNEQE